MRALQNLIIKFPVSSLLFCIWCQSGLYAQGDLNKIINKIDSTSRLFIISKERVNYTEKNQKTGRANLIIKERSSSISYNYLPEIKAFKCNNFHNAMMNSISNNKKLLDSNSVIQPLDCERRLSEGDFLSFAKMFNHNKDILDVSDFPIDDKWLKKNIDKSAIMQIADKRGAAWQFESKYMTKELKEKIFEGYANKDSVNLFLQDFPKTVSKVRSLQHSFRFIISFIHGNDTITFWRTNFDFNNPWMNGRNKGKAVTINPYINQSILNFIPKEFIGRSTLYLENFKWTYITWILVRNKYIGK